MSKKHMIVVGITSIAMLLVPNVMCTPVLAGITKDEMQTADNTALKNYFSTVTLGNLEMAYGVLRAVAEKTEEYDATTGRNYYALTTDFPLEYRTYFNQYKSGASGDTHSIVAGWNIYRIHSASGADPNDPDTWSFPDMESAAGNKNKMDRFLARTHFEETLYGDGDYDFADVSNATNLTDWTKGILSWVETIRFGDIHEGKYYSQLQTDDNGHAYHTSNIVIEDIVGKPGDKLKVEVYYFIDSNDKPAWYFSNYSTINRDDCPNAVRGNTLHAEAGYIYLPYTLLYDSNGGGINKPFKPTDANGKEIYYTCDDKSVTVLGQGTMTKENAKFYGWSETKTDFINDLSNLPSDLKEEGDTFEITKDMTLYAVWGVDAPAGATINVENRGTDRKQTGKARDSANNATPLYLAGAEFTLTEVKGDGTSGQVYKVTTGTAGDTKGKTAFTGIPEGEYALRETVYPVDNTNPTAQVKYTGFPSEWKVVVTKGSNDEFSVTVTDSDGKTEWRDKDGINEWYWTATATPQGNWWTADANTMLIYNLDDTPVAAGFGDFINGISLWEWLLAGGIAGGIITAIVIRRRRRRRLQQ